MVHRMSLKESISQTWELYYMIFFYNSFNNNDRIVDALVDPLYRFLERFAASAGRIFVCLVIILTTMVVVIYEYYIFPYNAERSSQFVTVFTFIFGHYLLINIVYNYYKGVLTEPGISPARIENPISICRNCISPKAPRTHHCSVCKRCVLKMDHHCPWLNNCVGHYNQRYFFLFCVYMTVGTIFVWFNATPQFRIYYKTSALSSITDSVFSLILGSQNATSTPAPESSPTGSMESSPTGSMESFWVMLEFFLCFGVTMALGGLTSWHAYLISRGETSIEKHINSKERKRLSEMGRAYRNPYDFGFAKNWVHFFSTNDQFDRMWWRNVLIPSSRQTFGDGKSWLTVENLVKRD